MSQLKTECGNPTCNCFVTSTETAEAYCSDNCSTIEETEERQDCACGHPQCDAE